MSDTPSPAPDPDLSDDTVPAGHPADRAATISAGETLSGAGTGAVDRGGTPSDTEGRAAPTGDLDAETIADGVGDFLDAPATSGQHGLIASNMGTGRS